MNEELNTSNDPATGFDQSDLENDAEMESLLADLSKNQPPPQAPAEPGQRQLKQHGLDPSLIAMLDNLPQEPVAPGARAQRPIPPKVAAAAFQQISQSKNEEDSNNIGLLMDVSLPVSIELGRTRMAIADILALGPGSVVELSKLAGEPVDVLINQKIVARGEVVVVDENFGVRITQLMTPEERLKALGEDR